MRVGPLRERVSIQSRSEARDANGGVTSTWTTVATRWGAVDPLAMNERLKGQRIDSIASHRVKLRYYDGLTPTHRILLGARVFGIVEILDPGERNREHLLLVKEDVA